MCADAILGSAKAFRSPGSFFRAQCKCRVRSVHRHFRLLLSHNVRLISPCLSITTPHLASRGISHLSRSVSAGMEPVRETAERQLQSASLAMWHQHCAGQADCCSSRFEAGRRTMNPKCAGHGKRWLQVCMSSTTRCTPHLSVGRTGAGERGGAKLPRCQAGTLEGRPSFLTGGIREPSSMPACATRFCSITHAPTCWACRLGCESWHEGAVDRGHALSVGALRCWTR